MYKTENLQQEVPWLVQILEWEGLREGEFSTLKSGFSNLKYRESIVW